MLFDYIFYAIFQLLSTLIPLLLCIGGPLFTLFLIIYFTTRDKKTTDKTFKSTLINWLQYQITQGRNSVSDVINYYKNREIYDLATKPEVKDIKPKAEKRPEHKVTPSPVRDINKSAQTMLYLGAGLFSFAYFILVAFSWASLSQILRILVVASVPLLFYLAGALLNRYKIYKDASITFYTVGAFSVYFSGLGFWNLSLKDILPISFDCYFIFYSVLSSIIYVLNYNYLKSPRFYYFFIFSIYSVFLSFSTTLTTDNNLRVIIFSILNLILYNLHHLEDRFQKGIINTSRLLNHFLDLIIYLTILFLPISSLNQIDIIIACIALLIPSIFRFIDRKRTGSEQVFIEAFTLPFKVSLFLNMFCLPVEFGLAWLLILSVSYLIISKYIFTSINTKYLHRIYKFMAYPLLFLTIYYLVMDMLIHLILPVSHFISSTPAILLWLLLIIVFTFLFIKFQHKKSASFILMLSPFPILRISEVIFTQHDSLNTGTALLMVLVLGIISLIQHLRSHKAIFNYELTAQFSLIISILLISLQLNVTGTLIVTGILSMIMVLMGISYKKNLIHFLAIIPFIIAYNAFMIFLSDLGTYLDLRISTDLIQLMNLIPLLIGWAIYDKRVKALGIKHQIMLKHLLKSLEKTDKIIGTGLLFIIVYSLLSLFRTITLSDTSIFFITSSMLLIIYTSFVIYYKDQIALIFAYLLSIISAFSLTRFLGTDTGTSFIIYSLSLSLSSIFNVVYLRGRDIIESKMKKILELLIFLSGSFMFFILFIETIFPDDLRLVNVMIATGILTISIMLPKGNQYLKDTYLIGFWLVMWQSFRSIGIDTEYVYSLTWAGPVLLCAYYYTQRGNKGYKLWELIAYTIILLQLLIFSVIKPDPEDILNGVALIVIASGLTIWLNYRKEKALTIYVFIILIFELIIRLLVLLGRLSLPWWIYIGSCGLLLMLSAILIIARVNKKKQ